MVYNAEYELIEMISRNGKNHPARRTYQALRIAINDELGELQALLNSLKNISGPCTVAAITFHSLEHKLVDKAFWAFHRAKKVVATIQIRPFRFFV